MLSLKQARRMAAKSRRRVWRLCRAASVTATFDRGMNFNGHALMLASTIAWAGTPEQRDAATRLCGELYGRMNTLHKLRYPPMPTITPESFRIGPDLMEVPEYEMGMGELCRVCGAEMDRIECEQCGGEGLDGHDCGEDVCCCLYPEDNEQCDVCNGKGGWWQCYQDHSNGQ